MKRAFKNVVSLGYGAARGLRKFPFLLIPLAAAAQAEDLTIAALGDSLTQGYGLPVNEGFVPQMQAWLDAQGAGITLINAGVSGDTTAGGLARVGWTLTPDVDGMIVALGGNDFLRGVAPEVSRANLDGILQAAEAAGVSVMLVGLEVSNNYGPDYKAAFDGMYPDLAAQYGATFYPTFFEGLLTEGDMAEARAAYLQPDGLHPNAEGVVQIVAHMGPVLLEFAEGLRAGQ
ncbi:arylesterase [Loktanella sp. IMCC34160]|uniref:arylesterase n=1 Tax=Loktanella sp. IMCC34160 TaxID=2510646 RepID=UPI00101D1FB6|nr:arylesterase [Loktanella sp. IMCC34160]RYG90550.1 arylesterase [Loktanella sp. IMCC34160]